MEVRLGVQFPDFKIKTTVGDYQLHQWLGDQWGILFSHPADYTPVCTTELARAAQLAPEFAKRHTKMIGLSCDSIDQHYGWIKDIHAYSGIETECPTQFPFPIIDDSDRRLATQLGMIDPVEQDSEGLPLTARAVFYIGPDKRLKAYLLYPSTMDEISMKFFVYLILFNYLQNIQLRHQLTGRMVTKSWYHQALVMKLSKRHFHNLLKLT
ncbi:hypothetical protein I4U23_027021 [Adineta vaga]|nr:hypothetical protein I4U23_027021 [Adineta vaga]